MEQSDWLLLAALGAGAYFWFNNKTKTKDVTTIRQTHTVNTPSGQVTYERVTETDSRRMDLQREGVERFMSGKNLVPPDHRPAPLRQAMPSKVIAATPPAITTTYQDVTRQAITIDAVKVPAPAAPQKVCGCCHKALPPSQFRHNPHTSDGLTKWCLHCMTKDNGRDRHHKICPHCHKRRLKTNFDKNSNQPDGLTKWCRHCMAAVRK